MTVDLRDLRYFAAVVEHASLTRASQALHVSQPTLTHAIARLEAELGGALWRRLSNRRAGVLPTELGRRALERGGRALSELAALSQDAALLNGVEAGSLRVGTIQSLAGTLLPRWVALFAEQHPSIVLDLPLVTSEAAADLVREGKVDAALVVAASRESGLKRLRCAEQELVVVMRRDHPIAKRRAFSLADLSLQPFVMVPAGTFAAIAIEDVCARAGFAPRVRCRLASISGLCALVRAGVGITILPEGSVAKGDADLVERRFGKDATRRTVHLLYRSEGRPSPALLAWLAIGREITGAAREA